MNEECKWTQDLNEYNARELNLGATDCDELFYIEEGTPEDNGMKYCSYCGKRLKQVIIELEEEEEEE